MDHRPALPVAVEPDGSRVYVNTATGEPMAAVERVYTEYDYGRIRAGYVCAHCDEAQIDRPCTRCAREGRHAVHRAPFPKHCFACGFPMRDWQARQVAEEFDGLVTLGPSRSREELRAEDDDAKARARYRREKPTSQILVPKGVRLGG